MEALFSSFNALLVQEISASECLFHSTHTQDCMQSIARFRFLKYKIKCYTSCQDIRDQDHYCFFFRGGMKLVRRQTIFFVVVCANRFFQCFFFFDCIILLTTYFLSPVGDLRQFFMCKPQLCHQIWLIRTLLEVIPLLRSEQSNAFMPSINGPNQKIYKLQPVIKEFINKNVPFP